MRRGNQSRTAAFSAVLGALSLLLLWAASAIPSGKLAMTALAGILPAGAVISAGLGAGFLTWAAVTLLGFLLVPDKLLVLLYGILLGLYPMVKSLIEGRKCPKPAELLLKLLFFNLALTVTVFTMGSALLGMVPQKLQAWWAIYLLGNVIFLAYDYGFSRLIAFYLARIDRANRG